MLFQSPGPILLELGPLSLRWYGLLYAIGFVFALEIADRYLRPQNVTKEELGNFAIVLLVSGLVGARLWYVCLNYEYFFHNPAEIPQIWLGGQSIQGGMVGAWIGTWLVDLSGKPDNGVTLVPRNAHLRFSKLRFLGTRKPCSRTFATGLNSNYLTKLSILITVIPLAQAIGRWGNFFNEEAYGAVTDLPWKLYISHTATYHHPTFLYESIWNLIVFAVLFTIYRKANAKPLTIIGLYLILYSIGRFFLEMLRTDSLTILGYPAASLMSVIGIVVGLVLCGVSRHSEERTKTGESL